MPPVARAAVRQARLRRAAAVAVHTAVRAVEVRRIVVAAVHVAEDLTVVEVEDDYFNV